MTEFIPVTNEVLERARHDEAFRHHLVSGHLDKLMLAMSRARDRAKTAPDADTAKRLQEGARLAVKLTEILNNINEPKVRRQGP